MSSCAACHKALVLSTYDDSAASDNAGAGSSQGPDALTVPDDVQMACGDHFHWQRQRQCLLDLYETTQCPNCGQDASSLSPATGTPQVLCDILNEGGFQEGVDILPILTEESYLRAYPNERKARAFLEFCRAGDVEAVIDLLRANEEDVRAEGGGGSGEDAMESEGGAVDAEGGEEAEEADAEDEDEDEDDEDDEEAGPPLPTAAILRYQDPIGSMYSALHFAVQSCQPRVVWLLLLLASDLGQDFFPQEVLQAARELGITRDDQAGKADIRALKDADGRTAIQLVTEEFARSFDIRLLHLDA